MKQDFYNLVGLELSAGYTDHGIMARAIDESNGNEHLSQSLYVRYRVEKLVAEATDYAVKRQAETRLQSIQEKVQGIHERYGIKIWNGKGFLASGYENCMVELRGSTLELSGWSGGWSAKSVIQITPESGDRFEFLSFLFALDDNLRIHQKSGRVIRCYCSGKLHKRLKEWHKLVFT
jgi:hypothetical protein